MWDWLKSLFFESDTTIEDSETGDIYSNEIMYIATLFAFLKQWIFILLGFFIFRKLLK